MRRFTYSPQVKAYINITEPTNPNYGKTIDVSEDIIEGSTTLRLGGLSSATLKLQNKNGKYLGGYKNGPNSSSVGYVFTPQDRIVIAMSRIGEPFQIFTGYLNKVPAFQLYPDAVTIEASCTLKRLWYTYFDPGIPAMIQYFAKFGYAYDPTTGLVSDPLARFGNWGIYGGISELISSILQDIGSWDPNTIRVDGLPQNFINAIESASGNFDISKGFASGSTPQVTVGTPSVNKNQTNFDGPTIIAGLVQRGLSVEAAAAFAGNFNNESGYVTNKVQGGALSNDIIPGQGYGLAQWTDFVRQSGLANLASKQAKPVYDYNVQLDYVMQEIQPKILGYLNANTNRGIQAVRDKTKIVFDRYEIPYVVVHKNENYDAYAKELASRQNAAVAAYQAYGINPNSFTNTVTTDNPVIYRSLLSIAGSQVGQSEQPPGSNFGGMVTEYLASVGYSKPAYWCAAFVFWCFEQANLGNLFPQKARSASCTDMWTNLDPSQRIPRLGGSPKAGDVIFYTKDGSTSSHVGIIEKVNADGTVNTIEGNAGLDWKTHQSIAVVRKTNVEIKSNVLGFGRITSTGVGIGINDGAANSIAGVSTTVPQFTTGTANSDLANGFVTQQLASVDSTLSYLLTGDHALANDIPLIEWIQNFVQGAGRVFCSAPNGDFFAFFPDYFGWFNSTPYFRVDEIELIDLNIQLSDQDLITHVYGVGPLIGYTQITPIDYATSAIASIQEPAFNAFVKTNAHIVPGPQGAIPDFANFGSPDFDPIKFLARYGARPSMKQLSNIRNPALLWMATWMEFMKQWAMRYQTTAQFTFMPELFPGGRINIADRLSMFIESVTHNFSYVNGFTTTAELIAATVEGTTLEGESQRTQQSGTQVGN